MIYKLLSFLFGSTENVPVSAPARAPEIIIIEDDSDTEDEPSLPSYSDFAYVREQGKLRWVVGVKQYDPHTMETHAQALCQAYQDLEIFEYTRKYVDLQDSKISIQRIVNQKGWANQDIIYEFCISLMVKYSDSQKIATFHPWFIKDGVFNKAYMDRLWAPRGEGEALKEANLIFMPINKEKHWYILGIQKTDQSRFKIYCADGFNSIEKHADFFHQARILLIALYKDETLTVEHQSILIPTQDNIYDCGYIACFVADRLASGEEGLQQLQACSTLASESASYAATRGLVIERLVEYAQQLVEDCRVARAPALLHSKRFVGEIASSSSSSDEDANPKRQCLLNPII